MTEQIFISFGQINLIHIIPVFLSKIFAQVAFEALALRLVRELLSRLDPRVLPPISRGPSGVSGRDTGARDSISWTAPDSRLWLLWR